MAMKPVRVGVVGLDHWYTAIGLVRTLAAHDGVELVGIVHDDLARGRAVAARVGVERVGTDPAELVDDPTVEAICSFSSVEASPDVCVAAARRGKHLMSVKPLARTLDQATAVLTAVRESGVAFLPAETRGRCSPHNQRLRQWIGEGRFGRILTGTFSLWSNLPMGWEGADAAAGPGWFADPDRTPGGAWIDHSIYQIDLLRWLLGAEVETVSGTAANLKHADLALEDYGHATLRFGDGTVATVEDTWTAAPGGGRTSMSLVGQDGAIAYDSLTGRLSLVGRAFAGEVPLFDSWTHSTPGAMRSDAAIDSWLAAVRGEQPAGPVAGNVEDAWANLAACLAFYESAAAGRPVAPATLPPGH